MLIFAQNIMLQYNQPQHLSELYKS